MSLHFLLDIAIILIAAKLLAMLSQLLRLPQVVGALIAGLIIGPSVLNLLHATTFTVQVAELGVVFIMFTAGLEVDVEKLKAIGRSGVKVAVCSALVPFIMGTILSTIYNRGDFAIPGNVIMQNCFLGIILMATSVSITVATLKEMGHLNSQVGNTVLAAALLDDIIGLTSLAIISGTADPSIHFYMVILKLLGYFLFAAVVYVASTKFLRWFDTLTGERVDQELFPTVGLCVCLLMAYCAEHFFGVADIIGAFTAGVIIRQSGLDEHAIHACEPISKFFFTPIFFASIGVKMSLTGIDTQLLHFAGALLATAVVSKVVGSALGAALSGYKAKACLQTGVSLIFRGEVALIAANKAMSLQLLPPKFFSAIVLMVVCVAVITPLLMKLAFYGEKPAGSTPEA
ncbi:MAG: cation:proton antiporter [Acidaminococcaceae bacterium]|nr:cation:proton antiporter [Acidaminococcaceae bacterium]